MRTAEKKEKSAETEKRIGRLLLCITIN